MSFRSALYVGSVLHRRVRPHIHAFRYRAFWTLVDLDELPQLARGLSLFSYNRFNLFSIYDADHGDGGVTPLRAQTEHRLAAAGLDLQGGAIRLLCMPRTLGYSFNPISVYFCHFADGRLAALLYEVHNTFGDRHSYVIAVESESRVIHQSCRKALYVSPFMEMDMRYDFDVTLPADRIALAIVTSAADGPVMNAGLSGIRRELNDRSLLRMLLAMPFITMKVMVAIHYEALRLWWKGLQFRRRPPPGEDLTIVGRIDLRSPD